MGKAFNRVEILGRLKKTIAERKPIIVAGCSAGIIAKCAELGGADLIVVYSTGKSRLMGLTTTSFGYDSNALTLEMASEILWAAQNTPVIGGCEASDVFRMDHSRLLDKFIEEGFHGIIPFPTAAMWDDWREFWAKVGMGFEREVQLVRLARQRNIFTMVYAHHPKDAATLTEAGTDVMIAHVGATRGGLVGHEYENPMDFAAAQVNDIIKAAKAVNPEVICLCHGGPFATPEDTVFLYERTSTLGFCGASTMERIPIEKAVREVVEAFKNVPMKKR
jgi:predicted TIM-barrel enzyme